LPNARRLGENSLAFLVHPTLDTADMQDVCEAVRKVMSVAAA
jgi:dTDP-4-amino-4,6-dideoxygalactose transaminase